MSATADMSDAIMSRRRNAAAGDMSSAIMRKRAPTSTAATPFAFSVDCDGGSRSNSTMWLLQNTMSSMRPEKGACHVETDVMEGVSSDGWKRMMMMGRTDLPIYLLHSYLLKHLFGSHVVMMLINGTI